MADDSLTNGLSRWPAEARDVPDFDSPSGPPLDGWLIAAGVVYPIAGFGALLTGGGRMGPAAFGPEYVLFPPLFLIALAVGLKLKSERLQWSFVAVFVAWVAVVAYGQFSVWAAAVASV